MRKIAIGLLVIFCCVAVKCTVGQTLRFTQIEKTSPVGAGSVVVTNTAGVLTYTTKLPSSVIPTLSAYVPYTGATSSVNLGANSFSVGGTSVFSQSISTAGILNTGTLSSTSATITGGLLYGTTNANFIQLDNSIDAKLAYNSNNYWNVANQTAGLLLNGGTKQTWNTSGSVLTGTYNVSGNSYLGGTGTSPTAKIHLAAGSTAASSSPLKFTSGALNTTAEAGAVEFLTDKAYLTITTGAVRKEICLRDNVGSVGRVPFQTTNGRLTDDASLFYSTALSTGLQVANKAMIGTNSAANATLEVRGTMSVSSTFSAAGRVEQAQGASVASANDLALGADGNSFEITGTKQINLITNTNWQNGSIIRLLFTSTPVVKNGQATSGANITIKLAGGVDFSATADDILTLELCTIGGTVAWREVSRSVN